MIQRFLIVFAAAAGVLAAAPHHARAGNEAALEQASLRFVQALADDAIARLTDAETPRETRVRHFRALFRERFAVQLIGRFVLGRHWRKASTAQQTEYLALFEELMIQRYVDRFASYSGETLELGAAAVEKPTRIKVRSRILRPDASKDPVEVEWVIGMKDGASKVLDVYIAGVSMALTLRADFGSIMRSDGVPGLIQALKDKITELNKSS